MHLLRFASILLFVALACTAAAQPHGVVMTLENSEDPKVIEDRYIVSAAFPQIWVDKNYTESFVIYSIRHIGSSWVVLMKKGLADWQQQRYRLGALDKFTRDLETDGYTRTALVKSGSTKVWVGTKFPENTLYRRIPNADEKYAGPDAKGGYIVQMNYTPRYTDQDAAGSITSGGDEMILLNASSQNIASQEYEIRSDPSAYFEKVATDSRILTSVEAIGDQWHIVSTAMGGFRRQVWFPMNAEKIKQYAAEGFKITVFY